MTTTHTRTYAVISRHFFEFRARRKAKKLNDKWSVGFPAGARSKKYEVLHQPTNHRIRTYLVIDWGSR